MSQSKITTVELDKNIKLFKYNNMISSINSDDTYMFGYLGLALKGIVLSKDIFDNKETGYYSSKWRNDIFDEIEPVDIKLNNNKNLELFKKGEDVFLTKNSVTILLSKLEPISDTELDNYEGHIEYLDFIILKFSK